MRATYDLLEEPTGGSWRGLLNVAFDYCDEFLLVTLPLNPLRQSAMGILHRLSPFLLSRDQRSEWPGTKLWGHTAMVYRFQLASYTKEILLAAAAGPYSWLQPELPEDLCFLRPAGTPWLVTIAHERDGYLDLSPEERTAINRRVPNLSVQLREEAMEV